MYINILVYQIVIKFNAFIEQKLFVYLIILKQNFFKDLSKLFEFHTLIHLIRLDDM